MLQNDNACDFYSEFSWYSEDLHTPKYIKLSESLSPSGHGGRGRRHCTGSSGGACQGSWTTLRVMGFEIAGSANSVILHRPKRPPLAGEPSQQAMALLLGTGSGNPQQGNEGQQFTALCQELLYAFR